MRKNKIELNFIKPIILSVENYRQDRDKINLSLTEIKNGKGYIPTIIVGIYLGNSKNLQLSSMIINDNNNAVQLARFYKPKETQVCYTTVSNERILPLIGYALFPTNIFGEYQICNFGNFKERYEELSLNPQENCIIL